MIREFQKADLDRVAEIWLNGNRPCPAPLRSAPAGYILSASTSTGGSGKQRQAQGDDHHEVGGNAAGVHGKVAGLVVVGAARVPGVVP